MISIIITAFKEPRTIGKAIEAFAKQKYPGSEIIVTAPDEETLNEARKLKKKYKNMVLVKDKGNGKSAAMNLAVKKAKGNILVFSDGDIHVSSDSLKNLIEQFSDEKIGAVSGRPISINKKDNKYGFWSYMLVDIAHRRRALAAIKGKRFFCSGYLFAIRKKLLPKLPEGLLSEDGYISHKVYSSGFKIGYAPKAEAYITYPDNFSDWIKQKKRSAGGYNQINKMIGVSMRSFTSESFGALGFLKYPGNLKETWWLIQLFIARVYLWIKIYIDINIKKKKREELWVRVESTK